MPRRFVLLLSLLALSCPALAASEWPHLRGPGYDGRVPAQAGIDGAEPGLELAWRVPLGSGYSGIAAASGRLVTMFSGDDSDWVAAFSAADGRELWRHRLDSVNRGRDGSADGPISTPAIAAGRVFALGPKGQLVALDLESGGLLWERRVDADFGSIEPDFGFGVTPLALGDRVILLTGGEERAVTALDAATGEVVWSNGAGDYRYQIPVEVRVDGRSHLVTAAVRRISGLDPADGRPLWEHRLAEDEHVGGALTAVGEGRVLVSVNGDAAVFSIGRTESGWALEESYRTEALGHTYALPVYHQGHLYGFRGQILTCVDARTGERVWRSRPPGGRGLIVIGDLLAIFGADGHVVLADATPEGYVERARVQALGASGYTWPSYADGRVLVRNLEEMAAVRLARASAAAAPERGVIGGSFGAFLERLAAAESPEEPIAEFLARHATLPIVEDEMVHFVWLGEAEDLAIAGSMTPTGNPEPMRRVPGTDLYYRSFPVEPGGRWEYQFIRDYSERLTDPRNPRNVPPRWGEVEMSELILPGYQPPGHLAERAAPLRGVVEELTFHSEILDLERRVKVYLPVGYHESENDYPLLIVHDGADWLSKGLLPNTLDNVIGRSARPVVAAFLIARDEWWLEAGGTGTDDHVEMLVNELLPLLEERYRLAEGPQSRALMGNTGYGVTSAYAALRHPELFGKVAIQSPQLGLGYEERLMELIAREPPAGVRFYLDWSRRELRELDAGVDLSVDGERLARALRAGGYDFTGGEVLDSAGWGGWRARTDRILETLFPLR